jgi:hypothetical protein
VSATDARTLTRQTLASASVRGGVNGCASERGQQTRVRRTCLSAQSVNALFGTRLLLATDAGSRESDASDAVGANAMNSNGQDTWQPLVALDAGSA